jgi:diguanylate cyclase
MSPQKRTLHQVYHDHLQSFYQDCNETLLESITAIITPVAEEIAAEFYDVMLHDRDGQFFLNHQLVHERLHASMSQWVRELFRPRHGEDISRFVDRQLQAGHVHARINLPPHLLNHGIRTLKNSISSRLIDARIEPLPAALTKVNTLLDITAALLTECYFSDIIESERQSQMLRQQLMGQDLALRCERLRADMFDWVRRLLAALHHKENVPLEQLPSARHSDFGLWITHKASLYFPDMQDVGEMAEQLTKLEVLTEDARQARSSNDSEKLSEVVSRIDRIITRISWLFSSLADHYAGIDNARDSLTKLYNRRFLNPVLQRETQYCMRNDSHYAILMVDLDHFKRVNDSFGHEAGDKILIQAAELMQANIRAGDFLFRYGGEEFMIVMTDIDASSAERVAHKIVETFKETRFNATETESLQVTVSVGVCMYRGHPDYAHVINEADQALYRAKQAGRNQYALAA